MSLSLKKLKPPADATGFSEEIYRAEPDKIWAQIRRGAFDYINGKI
ncbi:hypothetical protein [Siminovitchia terrae]|nr:hypothetical protein [Siminovitchia terrae]